MHSTTESHESAPGRKRRLRAPIVAAVAMVALFGGVACAPPSPPAGSGGVEVDFGPLVIPLPDFEIRPAGFTLVDIGLCSANYRPPGIRIEGATVSIPKVRIDPSHPIITVPNVKVNIPKLRVPLSTVTLTCLSGIIPVSLTFQADAIVPSQVLVKAITLNLENRTITFQDPYFTITGVGVALHSVINTGDIIVPLPPIVTIPFPGGAVAF
jgi:hypothetical protein